MTIVNTSGNGRNGWRTGPLYTLSEAARLARVSTATVKRWLFGYQTPSREMPPVFGEVDEVIRGQALISFLQLIEIVVASRFRRRRVPLERVRRAHEFAKDE